MIRPPRERYSSVFTNVHMNARSVASNMCSMRLEVVSSGQKKRKFRVSSLARNTSRRYLLRFRVPSAFT